MSDSEQLTRQAAELELDNKSDSDAEFTSPRSSFLDRSGGASIRTAEGAASPSSSGLGSGYESGEDSLLDAPSGITFQAAVKQVLLYLVA